MHGEPRERSEADLYHVTTRGVGKQFIFEDDEDRDDFLTRLLTEARKGSADVVAHALVENHVHAILQVPFENLSPLMDVTLGGYARSFNQRHGRTGHVFEGRFHSQPIDDDTYLLECVRYVHQNPVRAGLPGGLAYPWTSFPRYLRGEGSPIVMGQFASLDEFVRFHEASGRLWEHQRFDRPSGVDTGAEKLMAIAREALPGIDPADVKGLPRHRRDAALRDLVAVGLSLRQVELVTGISRSTVQRAQRNG